VLTCSSRATAAVIAAWACRSSADPERTALAPRGRCPTCVAEARLSLACTSAAYSCWALTPSERAAAATVGDDESAWPAANSGRLGRRGGAAEGAGGGPARVGRARAGRTAAGRYRGAGGGPPRLLATTNRPGPPRTAAGAPR